MTDLLVDIADWLAAHEKWVTIPASSVILVRGGFLMFALAWLIALTVTVTAQSRIWEDRQ